MHCLARHLPQPYTRNRQLRKHLLTQQIRKNKHDNKTKDSKQKVDEPENAIGKDAAEEKALADAGVTEEQAGKVRIHTAQLDDETIVYKVKFTYNDMKYSYQINATSGEVVEKTSEAVTENTTKSKKDAAPENTSDMNGENKETGNE